MKKFLLFLFWSVSAFSHLNVYEVSDINGDQWLLTQESNPAVIGNWSKLEKIKKEVICTSNTNFSNRSVKKIENQFYQCLEEFLGAKKEIRGLVKVRKNYWGAFGDYDFPEHYSNFLEVGIVKIESETREFHYITDIDETNSESIYRLRLIELSNHRIEAKMGAILDEEKAIKESYEEYLFWQNDYKNVLSPFSNEVRKKFPVDSLNLESLYWVKEYCGE